MVEKRSERFDGVFGAGEVREEGNVTFFYGLGGDQSTGVHRQTDRRVNGNSGGKKKKEEEKGEGRERGLPCL